MASAMDHTGMLEKSAAAISLKMIAGNHNENRE
jgi:hypothetical protein